VRRYSFKLPDVGEGIAEAEIVAWHVGPGDRIAEDAPLVDVMTDKATVEITSPVAGRVLEIKGEVGQPVAIGSVVAVLEVAGAGAGADEPVQALAAEAGAKEAAPLPPPAPPPAAASPPPAVEAPLAAPPAPAQATPRPGVKPLASPAVRRRALELGVPLQFVPGSGPLGRITQHDLEAYAAHPGAAGGAPTGPARREGSETVKVVGLRRRIAERMSEAKRRIPHFSYIEEIDVTDLERLRAQLNAEHKDRPRLTVLPFLVRALVRALPAFPQINATYDDEAGEVTRHAAVHLGIAAQTPAGLMVPVLRHAEALDLWAAAAEIARLAEAARNGSALREELGGSTITLTSLGPLGGLASTPVINRPEVAIIGPNRIIERPVVVDGAVAVRKMMNLSSSFDHRVVDGWDAAEFVQRLKRLLETPALLFVDQP
jgi:2-oxoisovalerate dehydrogenase E2 component (dihydrolipoyl transacylase)